MQINAGDGVFKVCPTPPPFQKHTHTYTQVFGKCTAGQQCMVYVAWATRCILDWPCCLWAAVCYLSSPIQHCGMPETKGCGSHDTTAAIAGMAVASCTCPAVLQGCLHTLPSLPACPHTASPIHLLTEIV